MLTRAQIILVKRAQAEAGLEDGEYRAAIESVTGIEGCLSSRDARLTDGHLDRLMGYFEAIYWRKVEGGEMAPPALGQERVFRVPGYWGARNRKGNTSRDRYVAGAVASTVAELEAKLASLGFGAGYCAAIRKRMGGGSSWAYRAALERTLEGKLKQKAKENVPF